MAFRVYKFTNITELEHWLRGGIIGNNPQSSSFGIGYYGLVGATITFTTPSGSVTFVTGSADPTGGFLTFAEVKAQIEAAVSTLAVSMINGRISIIEKTPSGGVDLGAAGAEPARAVLGFDGSAGGHNKNVVKNPMVGATPSTPYVVHLVSPGNDLYIVTVQE